MFGIQQGGPFGPEIRWFNHLKTGICIIVPIFECFRYLDVWYLILPVQQKVKKSYHVDV
jgi:hypothetical protein